MGVKFYNYKAMGKLTFEYTDRHALSTNREIHKVELGVPDDLTVQEYKVICIRLAQSLGFAQSSIDKAFGHPIYGSESPDELKKLLLDINRTSK